MEPLTPLARARRHLAGGPALGAPTGEVLDDVRSAAIEVREQIRRSGRPDGVATVDLVTLPRRRSAVLPGVLPLSPVVAMRARMTVVVWSEGGRRRVLLWNASDHELVRPPERGLGSTTRRLATRPHGSVLGHLRALGIDRADVDLVAHDHLHRTDLRRLLGTTAPDPRLGSPHEPVEPWLPAARLLVQRAEWDTMRRPDPLQAPRYAAGRGHDVRDARVERLDGDVLLGPGVAIVASPGHTPGSQTLLLHLDEGVAAVSGNGIAVDLWAPRSSRIPGLRRWALAHDVEVAPTPGGDVSAQHLSMVAEVEGTDRWPATSFPLVVPATELTPTPLTPLLRPTLCVGGARRGVVVGSSATAAPR